MATTTTPLVAEPVYSTITKGPRAGRKIINWPATADKYEEALKTARALVDELRKSNTTYRDLYFEANDLSDKHHCLLLSVACHPIAMFFLPRDLRDQLKAL